MNRRPVPVFVGFSLLVVLCLVAFRAAAVEVPTSFSGPRVRFIDLTANRFSDQRVLVVSGYVENVGDESIQGHVIVYLKDGVSVINAIDAPLNNGVPIAGGSKGYFELTTNIGTLPPVGAISVEFVSSRIPLQPLTSTSDSAAPSGKQ